MQFSRPPRRAPACRRAARRDELQQLAAASHDEMRRHLQPADRLEVGMRVPVELVGEELLDLIAAVDARRQADRMQHQQRPTLPAGRSPKLGDGQRRAADHQPACQRGFTRRACSRAVNRVRRRCRRCRRSRPGAPCDSASAAATARGSRRPRCGCSDGARARAHQDVALHVVEMAARSLGRSGGRARDRRREARRRFVERDRAQIRHPPSATMVAQLRCRQPGSATAMVSLPDSATRGAAGFPARARCRGRA